MKKFNLNFKNQTKLFVVTFVAIVVAAIALCVLTTGTANAAEDFTPKVPTYYVEKSWANPAFIGANGQPILDNTNFSGTGYADKNYGVETTGEYTNSDHDFCRTWTWDARTSPFVFGKYRTESTNPDKEEMEFYLHPYNKDDGYFTNVKLYFNQNWNCERVLPISYWSYNLEFSYDILGGDTPDIAIEIGAVNEAGVVVAVAQQDNWHTKCSVHHAIQIYDDDVVWRDDSVKNVKVFPDEGTEMPEDIWFYVRKLTIIDD